MGLPTTPDIEESRMAFRAVLEEAEALALDLRSLMPTNEYACKAQDAIQEAVDALDDLAEEITGEG